MSQHDEPEDDSPEQRRYVAAMERLKGWAALHLGQILGITRATEGRSIGYRDLFEMLLALRAENSALTLILLERGIVTHEELRAAFTAEAVALDLAYQRNYPGAHSEGEDGLQFHDLDAAAPWLQLWPK